MFTAKSQQIDDSLSVQNIILDSHITALYEPSTIQIKLESEYNIEGAKKAIRSNKMKILFPGGWAGVPDFDNGKDLEFQKKYNVDFLSQGCVRFGENEDEEGYNLVIFEYLDDEFGLEWRNEMRTDAIGFIPPIKNDRIDDSTGVIYSKINYLFEDGNEHSSKRKKSSSISPSLYVFWIIIPVMIFGTIWLLLRIRKRKK